MLDSRTIGIGISFPLVSRWGLVLTTHPFSALVVHGYKYTSTSLCSHCMLQDDLDLKCQCYNLSHNNPSGFGRIMVKDYTHTLLTLYQNSIKDNGSL